MQCTPPIMRAHQLYPHSTYKHTGTMLTLPTPAIQASTHIISALQITNKYNALHYIGIAADEPKRIKNEVYPLVEWGITEAQALQICYDRGFDWNGLYEIYHRCSCWCCPFQRIDELRKLRRHHPELWEKLREMDERALGQFGSTALGQFKDNWTVEQLEHRFAAEDAAAIEARKAPVKYRLRNASHRETHF